MRKGFNLLLRIIVFPFILGVVLVKVNGVALWNCVGFLIYGGEFIPYQKNEAKTINEIYSEIKKQRTEE